MMNFSITENVNIVTKKYKRANFPQKHKPACTTQAGFI